ncbi:hypothetical protein LY76DRAFT_47973 [Colletotrichum caudatum]|nr:hypothetical protein LY76DRAFT_47973 [Colletotrichum caudatum]
MAGTLVPPWFEASTPTNDEQNIASMLWGFTLGVGLWSGVRGYRQSMASWKRTHRVNTYVWLLWMEWTASMIIGIVSWCYLTSLIKPSFEYFFLLLVLWSIQVQCLMQIIVNRIAVLMMIPSHATRLKWVVFAVLLAVNISVFCIWIPARLQISETYVHINEIWDRIEKGIFLVVDAGLNLTFIYLVKSRLIAGGLTKYTVLFRFNLVMIAISMSLDVVIIGLMSLPNTLIYAQFHPLAYLIKLHIEMGMADLIAKIVKASHPMSPHLEPWRDNNDITPDLNKHDSLLRSAGSKRPSPLCLDRRDTLSPGAAQPEQSITGPGGQPVEAGSQLDSQTDAYSRRLATSTTLSRPCWLRRHFTEPGTPAGLETITQSGPTRSGSGSTARDDDRDVAWYV